MQLNQLNLKVMFALIYWVDLLTGDFQKAWLERKVPILLSEILKTLARQRTKETLFDGVLSVDRAGNSLATSPMRQMYFVHPGVETSSIRYCI